MKTSSTILLAALMILTPAVARADNACTGTENVTEIEIGCDGEATRDVSLAKCDFRSGKVPDIRLSNVIDGRTGNETVIVDSSQAGKFTVTIRPLESFSAGYCKVWRFDWLAE